MKEGELSAQGRAQAAGLRRRRPGESERGDGRGARDRSEPRARVRSIQQPIAQLVAPSVGSALFGPPRTRRRLSAGPESGRSAQAWRLVVGRRVQQVEASCDAGKCCVAGLERWHALLEDQKKNWPPAVGESAVGWFPRRQDSPQPIEPPDEQRLAMAIKPPTRLLLVERRGQRRQQGPDGRERGNRSGDPLATGNRPIHRANRSC